VLDNNRVENTRIRVDVKETADAYTVHAEIPG
jgi:HSP20 family molecular chaperone IbpA